MSMCYFYYYNYKLRNNISNFLKRYIVSVLNAYGTMEIFWCCWETTVDWNV